MPEQKKPLVDPAADHDSEAERRRAQHRARTKAARQAERQEQAGKAKPHLRLHKTSMDDDDDDPPKPLREVTVKPVAERAKPRRRHMIMLVSFVIMVVLPTLGWSVYLWVFAKDQYHSTVGFSVRKEDTSPAIDILGGITSISGSGSSDSDILYQYIQSQELVKAVNKQLDLRAIWSKAKDDPWFALSKDVPIEDLTAYWKRMVRINYDSNTGLIELRVLAFDPHDAQKIAQAILADSSRMINDLSAVAREDATRYAREDLAKAVDQLKAARQALTSFRSRTQIVDPTADIQGQMGLLNSLQTKLADALINLDLLHDTTREGDPRIAQVQRRIDVIKARIEDERKKFGVGTGSETGNDYATLVSEYERLNVDQQFAQQAYTAARAAYDSARAEAQRQSRYLAPYVQPTLAQTSQYPQRWVLAALVATFAFLGWAMMVLIYYSIRDRA